MLKTVLARNPLSMTLMQYFANNGATALNPQLLVAVTGNSAPESRRNHRKFLRLVAGLRSE
jgi:hypothetical protein